MSTLNEHTGNGNPTATRLQREDTKERIDGVLRNFDVLPSRFDRVIFKYIYVYLICLVLPGVLLLIPPTNSQLISQPQAGTLLLGLGVTPCPLLCKAQGSTSEQREETDVLGPQVLTEQI